MPASLISVRHSHRQECFYMERDKRIELLTEDWKSAVLPLN
jgi:hypothetical protein